MSEIVDPEEIERVVGVRRHATLHFGRAVSGEQRVFVLHSEECVASTADLRKCEYSVALDRGIEALYPWLFWSTRQDQPLPLTIEKGWLVPQLNPLSADSSAERGLSS